MAFHRLQCVPFFSSKTMASRDCDRDRGADALQQVFSLTLQINGVICRLQAGKLQINQAAEKCMTLTDQID